MGRGVDAKMPKKGNKFTIAIEETVVENFEVIAESPEEALEIAERQYKKGEIVLTSGDVQFRQMAVLAPKGEATEWREF